VVIINCFSGPLTHRLDNNELTIDMQHELGQLCYVITLMTLNVTLTIRPKKHLCPCCWGSSM
jgi:hypothetical protein